MENEKLEERILYVVDKLTARQKEVLGLFEDGKADTSAEVADVLFVSKRTVDFHLANTYGQMRGAGLKVKNREGALRVYRTYRALKDQNYGKTQEQYD